MTARPAALQDRDVALELLTGPLPGIYDPHGMGSTLFAVRAVAAQLDRDYIRDKTLDGQAAAAAKSHHRGRPRVIDCDMVVFAARCGKGHPDARHRREAHDHDRQERRHPPVGGQQACT
ncbi:MAG: hypothetical protein ACRDRK_25100 [Pseudonocardia sp.]